MARIEAVVRTMTEEVRRRGRRPEGSQCPALPVVPGAADRFEITLHAVGAGIGQPDDRTAPVLLVDGAAHQPVLLERRDHAQARRERHAGAGRKIAGAELAIMRSEEHTSELQSLMRNTYAVLCLKKKK